MRSIPALVAAASLVALAACGPGASSGRFEKGDGTFDREAYRAYMDETCRVAAAASASPPPPEIAGQFCGCVSDRILRQTDAELRAEARDTALDDAHQLEAFRACAPAYPALGLRFDESTEPVDGSSGVPEELPPPPDIAGEGGDLAPGNVSARARANLANYFSADDYPAAALRNGEQGRVGFAVEVDATGRVSACRVTESSGSALLDSTTCQIIRRRARYTPARDARGAVTAGRDQASITWRLPSG